MVMQDVLYIQKAQVTGVAAMACHWGERGGVSIKVKLLTCVRKKRRQAGRRCSLVSALGTLGEQERRP